MAIKVETKINLKIKSLLLDNNCLFWQNEKILSNFYFIRLLQLHLFTGEDVTHQE